jgi:hypothetical protein
MTDKPKRDRDHHLRLPAEDPEATLQALIAVNPGQGPELTDEDLRRVVVEDQEQDEPGES